MISKRFGGHRWKERGNVLFLILIAVALFAALSYAVTQSTRSGGGDAGKETSKIGSAQLTQYPAGVRTSLVRMIIGGQDVSTLEFNSPAQFPTCTAGFERCVFHPNGGGATFANASPDLLANHPDFSGQWTFNAQNEIENIGTTTAGAGAGAANSTTADLIAYLPGVAKSVCDAINDELGLPVAVGSITETGITYTSATNMVNLGTPTSINGSGGSIGVAATALAGQPFGCFFDTGPNPDAYVYYHVLIER